MSDEQQIYTDEEVVKMFDTEFLPTIQELARRCKKIKYQDVDIKLWEVKMNLQFSNLDKTLRYEDIEGQIRLQLVAITQEMIDELVKDNDQSSAELS